MSKATIAELEGILNQMTQDFKNVSGKKMFGCHALWVNGNVFALVWKHGRIGVKLPDTAHYEKLMGVKGSEPWKAGPMQMSHWVLVPESFHEKAAELKKWAATAHALCATLEKKPKKKLAAKATKKATIKKKRK